MSDTSIGNEAGQAQASETQRIPSETASGQTDGQGQGSNSQSTTNETNSSTNNNNTTNQANNQTQTKPADSDADKRVREATREAGNYRTQLRDVQALHEEAKASLSTITAERDQLRAEIREMKVTQEVQAVVNDAQPHSLRDVMKLIDMGSIKIDGRTGQVDIEAIAAKVEQLQKESPYLFKRSNLGGDAGAGGVAMNGANMNRELRRAAGYDS